MFNLILGGINDEVCFICFIFISLFKVRIYCLIIYRDWFKSNVIYFNVFFMGVVLLGYKML